MKKLILFVAGLSFIYFLTSCGEETTLVNRSAQSTETVEGSSFNPAEPDGEFWAKSITVDGKSVDIVENTTVSVKFEDAGVLSVATGCNSAGGSFKSDNEFLELEEVSMTQKSCGEIRDAQESLVLEFLGASPKLTVVESGFKLETDDTTIEFVPRSTVDSDESIIDTKWRIQEFKQGDNPLYDVFIDDDSAPGTESPYFMFKFEDGSTTLTGFDGCNQIPVIDVEIEDGSSGEVVEGDGEIQLGSRDDLEKSSDDCAASQVEFAKEVKKMLDSQQVFYVISYKEMVITNKNGFSILFVAENQPA